MKRLTKHFLGFEMENPWCIASGPPSATGKLIARAFDMGWAGAVIKTIGPVEEPIINVAPRIQTMRRWNREIAMQNIELITDRKLSVWLEELKILRKRYPRKMIIASIMAPGNDMNAWAKLTEEMNKVGCDAVELNLGCPHGMPERGMGAICSQDPEIVFNIVTAAKASSKVPILTKLTPNVTNIKVMAIAAKKAGGDAITVINTVNGIIGFDIYRREPLLSVNGYTAIGGISGSAIKPIGLKCVVECKEATGLAIAGVGGISTWEDGVEYFLAGADQLQICTEVMVRGFKIITGLNKGLGKYLDKMGYENLEAVKSTAHKQVTSFDFLLKRSGSPKVSIQQSTCTGCKICVVACDDAGYSALKMTAIADEKRTAGAREVASLIDEYCTGCNLCVSICPVPGAIALCPTKNPFPYELHKSYTDKTL